MDDKTVARESELQKQLTAKGNNCLYVVFSSTPYKMGRFIRVMTRHRYNHVAVSLDPELRWLYSFARHYRNTPFYGGFVRETPARYRYRGRVARIKVCAIPITDAQRSELETLLRGMKRASRRYRYNLLSATTVLFHRRVRLPNAYTCVEFVVDLIHRIVPEISLDPARTYSVHQLGEMFAQYEIYSGEFPERDAVIRDGFDRKKPNFWQVIWLTLSSNCKLLASLFQKKTKE